MIRPRRRAAVRDLTRACGESSLRGERPEPSLSGGNAALVPTAAAPEGSTSWACIVCLADV